MASSAMLTPSVRIYVIRPVVSPLMSMPSYSFCAVRIVRCALNPSFRDASCCIVDVVKGAAGRRRVGLLTTFFTIKLAASTVAFAVLADVSLFKANFSSFSPLSVVSFAINVFAAEFLSLASMDQYSSELNFSISSSRSQISRRATDCTRPADFEPGSLRQRTGDKLNPTK